MKTLIPLILLLIVFAVLSQFITALTKKRKAKNGDSAPDYPYESNQKLLSPAERSLLGILEQFGGTEYRIMSKVRLADIVSVTKGLSKSAWQKAFNRIQSRHVDFLLCQPDDLSIVCAIELDDATHQRKDRKERDAFVDEVMKTAGIPIFHIPAKKSYSVEDISAALGLEAK